MTATVQDPQVYLTIGLVISAHVSGLIFVGVLLTYARDAHRLVAKYRSRMPFTSGALQALLRLSWASIVALLLLATAYTIRLLLLRPLIVPYPSWAFYLDVAVYLFLTVILIIPSMLMITARKKLKDMEDSDNAA